jgi:hypothetical protein
MTPAGRDETVKQRNVLLKTRHERGNGDIVHLRSIEA